MRGLAAGLAVALICVAGLPAGGTASAASAGSGDTPSRALITADEYSLVLLRGELARGPAIPQNYNRGEDPHDLRLRRLGHSRVYQIPTTAPGSTESLQLRMGTGHWVLWCSLAHHRSCGMEANLRVKKHL